MAIRQVKSGKATGPNNIPAEALKSNIAVTTNMLHLLFKKIWEEEQVTMDWREGHLIKIPKKGDLSKCENYRGITLLSVPGKVFNRVFLNRMKDAVDVQHRNQKAGYRKDRSCTDRIATLRSSSNNQSENTNAITSDDKTLEDVKSFTYLGSIIDEQGGSDADVKARIGKARAASLQLKNILNSKQLNNNCLLLPFLFLLMVNWIINTTMSQGKHGVQWSA
ncbi:unnamed protein product [Schistosoma margrebowiei]|uniref:Uncharacterized protein n=1 Tax=Schistosoma margrebowiei TaxID=48269 RepID=A0A183LNR8_9TREM|nr:unnamed protein product [Schistosoma margrebowiei]